MAVDGLPCAEKNSVERAVKEGANRFALLAALRPGKNLGDGWVRNYKLALTAVQYLQRQC
jgi:hypothetical protein